MSVTGGKFFGDHWTYVAGAPKAALGSGQVFFFTKVCRMRILKHIMLFIWYFSGGLKLWAVIWHVIVAS